jgi:ketosteroid isomerase-like protein
MPQENIEIVRESLLAYADRGLDALAEFWDADISWRAIEGAPDDVGEMRGPEAVRRYLQDWLDMFDDVTNVPEEVLDLGDDRVVAVQHATGRAKASGVQTDIRYAVVYTLRDGKIVRGREYIDRNQALEAVGLREGAMSQRNVDVVRKAVDALSRQDADAFVASAHPEIEWEATDDRFPGFRALYRGRTGVRRWFEEAVEPWESVHNQIEEVTDVGGDRVLLDLLMTTRGGTSGVETTLRLWQALWFKDGLVVKRQGPYWTRADALEAMGLRE